jgi:beta-glucosidase
MADTYAEVDPLAILSQLTLEEKAALLDGSGFWHTQGVERLGVPAVAVADGPHGLRKVREDDQLRLNSSVPATCFPPAAGLASSWDPDLVVRVGEALGDECRAAGVAVLLGPGANMKRSPLCGRNFEYFSEDPLLAGVISAAWVRGVQNRGVGASLKHFAANNQEADRLRVSAEVDERTLREIYLPAFERAVKQAQPWTVMCSYNKINGTYASEDRWLLSVVLRDEWGFEGLVVSDWGAVNRRDLAVAAGLDLEMPSSGGHGTQVILDAVAAGTLTEAEVDRAAVRILRLVAQAGKREPLDDFDVDAHHALAREAAAASVVLLRNDGGALPLDAERGGAVAVIGEFARTPRFQGAGSSQINPTKLENALDCLRAELEGKRDVVFAAGFETEREIADPDLIAEAVRVAADAEVALVFLGLPPSYESEGYDREHMHLPSVQLELLSQVAAANSNVVVVLSNGSAVLVSEWEHQARALVEGWLLGQAGAAALVDVILGKLSPSGRLAETIPQKFEHNPTVGNFPGDNQRVNYGEGLLIGYRWYDAHELPVAYPFGHGLSYTTFDYADLELKVTDDGPKPAVSVSLTVTNTGDRAGPELVQVYVSDPFARVYRPAQELRAFTKVALEPGESRRIELELDDRAFAYWHLPVGDWVVEGGEFQIRVGASSRDIRLTGSVTLTGANATTPLNIESTFAEFLAVPEAGDWLKARLEGSPLGDRLLESELGRMLGSVPVQRFARFPGISFTEADIDGFVATLDR